MAETKRDYYEVLGINKLATEAEIKKAYRELAKKYHPDAHPGDKEAEAKFKEASEAYAILSDTNKRKQYDQFGHAAFSNGNGFDFSSFDFGDIFGDIFGGGNPFGGFGGFGGFQTRSADPNQPRRGADVRATLNISFMEAINGCEKSLQGNYKDICTTCNGSGCKPGTEKINCTICNGTGKMVSSTRTPFGISQTISGCTSCNGTGKIVKDKCKVCNGLGYKQIKKTFKVSIPAGINNGQAVRLAECGEPGINGGPRGDLLVFVTIQPHEIFTREGLNIYSNVHIPFTTAILGDTIEIPTIYDNEYKYIVQPGTQSHTRVVLEKQGVINLQNKNQKGNHIITIIVDIPTTLTNKQRELIEAYKNEEK